MAAPNPPRRALRGPALTFTDDPFLVGVERAMRYEPDALILIEGGRIAAFGPFDATRAPLPTGTPLDRFGADSLILPGFIDTHVHFAQTDIVGAFGVRLIDWLERYAFPAEARFADAGHARAAADAFLRECLRAGTTTAMVYGTVHPQSVDAFFSAAERLGMRMIAGKVMMDRNAPAPLLDSARKGYDESKALIRAWHGRGRLLYAVTPRFAPTSSPEQMEAAGALWREHPGTYLQTHVCESVEEIAWTRSLFPERSGSLDVHDHYGHVGARAVLGHGVYLGESELAVCHARGAAIAHCPTSNLFLGSGLLDLGLVRRADRPVRVGLGTDLGAGTSFSSLRVMGEAYKVAQLNRFALGPAHACYLATRGGAEALYLHDTIGSIGPGYEADLVVLDLRSTPVIDLRMRHCEDVLEALFIQMTLADERATRATYVAGEPRYVRDEVRSISAGMAPPV